MVTEEQGCSWPEQDAIDKWWEAHSFELKRAVTQPRLKQQERADQAERRAPAPDALVGLLAQWRKEITGAPKNTDYLRGYWEGRATAHNDLDGTLKALAVPRPERTHSAEEAGRILERHWDAVIHSAEKIEMPDKRKLADWATLMNRLRDGYEDDLSSGGGSKDG